MVLTMPEEFKFSAEGVVPTELLHVLTLGQMVNMAEASHNHQSGCHIVVYIMKRVNGAPPAGITSIR